MSESERLVQLFRNGRNQAIRIPRDLELPGKQALIRKDGNRLILEPVEHRSLVALLAQLAPIDEDFAPIDELPIEPVDL